MERHEQSLFPAAPTPEAGRADGSTMDNPVATTPRVVCSGNLVHDEVFHVGSIPTAGFKSGVLRYDERYGGPAATAAVAIVLVDRRGETSIVSDRRALAFGQGVLARLPLDGVGVVLTDTRWPEGAELVLRRARAAGIVTVLDADGGAAAANAQLIAMADHVVLSSEGLKDYAGEGDPGDLLRRCATRPE
ncbi:carbohydrate kinase family protein [Marinimicrococcus flavescens]|uniref:Uncharacterized protein n=1 Tax=Marinimicrococcus flavescens TaxID=3031815 RepID=A0AAP3XRR7_9PROT|nr:hypothetical protein [Marinimicrococcus flavescens]